ncbi:hypothetical protein MKK75_17545 [Methylobacterium sp. J-030]|uniref:hypothetical protein n=1 Tax=Methylobacterium sp. J-030 TaxID=2836627 RepID=UPI001FBBD4D9|nr:hypothetical protein [Methylobacterium sp. J-030]MCJ2070576.1 hypothetical protein [Methylobacterium sp. J-030]
MLDDPRYTLSEVAIASGVQVGTLRSWLQRGHWRVDTAVGDSPAAIAGKAHLVTLRRALHIGAAVELVRNDVEPARAFRAARSFVDIFDPHWEHEGRPRDEGGLFVAGWTLLVVYPSREDGIVMWIDDTQPLSKTPLQSILFPKIQQSQQVSGTFVWLNQIDRRIRLGLKNAEG